MEQIPLAEMERTMKVQEVILRSMAKKITWWQAAEILGVSNRTMRRWKWNYENKGFKGLAELPQSCWKLGGQCLGYLFGVRLPNSTAGIAVSDVPRFGALDLPVREP